MLMTWGLSVTITKHLTIAEGLVDILSHQRAPLNRNTILTKLCHVFFFHVWSRQRKDRRGSLKSALSCTWLKLILEVRSFNNRNQPHPEGRDKLDSGNGFAFSLEQWYLWTIVSTSELCRLTCIYRRYNEIKSKSNGCFWAGSVVRGWLLPKHF